MSETHGPWGFVTCVADNKWHPPLIVPAYLEDDDVCSDCGRPFVDIRSCDKCKVPDTGLYRLVPDRFQLSETHTFVRILDGETDVFGFIRIPIDTLPVLARMIDCRNLVDGPESYADNYEYEDGVTGHDIDEGIAQLVEVAIDRTARRVVKLCVWKGLRTEALVEEVKAAIREEMKL